jgi:hypothetical protein
MNEICKAKPTEGKSTPQYKTKIFYEYRASEAWFLIYGFLSIKENVQCPTPASMQNVARLIA